MRVSRHQHHKQVFFDYSIHNKTLENLQSAKYLDIIILDNMDCGQHISEVSSKGSKKLGYLCRIMSFAHMSTKEAAYKMYVWPKLEYYAAPIWSTYFIVKIIRLQPAEPAGDDKPQIVSARCLVNLSGPLLMHWVISSLCTPFIRFIIVLCQLKQTSTWPCS